MLVALTPVPVKEPLPTSNSAIIDLLSVPVPVVRIDKAEISASAIILFTLKSSANMKLEELK